MLHPTHCVSTQVLEKGRFLNSSFIEYERDDNVTSNKLDIRLNDSNMIHYCSHNTVFKLDFCVTSYAFTEDYCTIEMIVVMDLLYSYGETKYVV